MSSDPTAKHLAAYPPALRAQVRVLMAKGRLAETLERRYPERHDIASDAALYDHVNAMKIRHMRNAGPLAKVLYDSRLHLTHQALGTHTAVSRRQGGHLKAKREIRIAGLFREAPAAFLRMIVVHELAHLKVREHDKAFYALCTHMEPSYHQLEFDVRLWPRRCRAQRPVRRRLGTPARLPGGAVARAFSSNVKRRRSPAAVHRATRQPDGTGAELSVALAPLQDARGPRGVGFSDK